MAIWLANRAELANLSETAAAARPPARLRRGRMAAQPEIENSAWRKAGTGEASSVLSPANGMAKWPGSYIVSSGGNKEEGVAAA